MPNPIVMVIAAGLLATAAHGAPADVNAEARRLLNSQGCKACHRLDAEGATLAAALDKIGAHLDREQIRAALVNPQHRHPGGRIADFGHLRDDEIEALVTFLSQRK